MCVSMDHVGIAAADNTDQFAKSLRQFPAIFTDESCGLRVISNIQDRAVGPSSMS